MKTLFLSALLLGSMSITAFAYDANKAKELQDFYAGYTHQACADSKLYIEADEVMEMYRKNKKFTLLDIRTGGENILISLGGENSMYISMKDLFKKENLDKLPTDQPILIVCYSGTRAILASAGLSQIGIKNSRVVLGGIVALAGANSAANSIKD